MALSLSKRLLAAYVFDWIIIVAIAGVAGWWNGISPFHRPFSVLDLTISYPRVKEQVSPTLLLVVSLIIPAAIIFLIALIFVPGPTASRHTPKSLIWRRKFWEWNTGWMGLGLSLATTWLITNGMKNLFGKPRPNMIARCDPDLANLAAHIVGDLDDAFRSFPSGHSSSSWAGLLYLTLFLCSKFAIAVPFLPPRPYSQDPAYTALEAESSSTLPLHRKPVGARASSSSADPFAHGHELDDAPFHRGPGGHGAPAQPVIPIRNQAAAPPVYLWAIAFAPVAAAIYICSSRYADFYHHGFDIISGALIGIACAYISFRWYHLPIRQGAGWSWGARSRDRAFYIGVGVGNYVGPEGWASKKAAPAADVESGRVRNDDVVVGPGLDGDRVAGRV